MPLSASHWLKLMQNCCLQFSTAISTHAALTLWYWSIWPNEHCWVAVWWKKWHLVSHIHSKHPTTYKLRNTAIGCQLSHGWYLNSWLGLKRPKPKQMRSHNWCPLIGGYASPVWCLLWSKAHWWPKVMGSYTICLFLFVFIMHWPHRMNAVACLPLGISYDPLHWGSCQPAVWECWHYSGWT